MPHIVNDESTQNLDALEPEVPHVVPSFLPSQREEKVRDEEPILAQLGGAPELEGLDSILDPFLPAPTAESKEDTNGAH